MIEFSCKCGAKFKTSDDKAGRRSKCSTCGKPLVVPSPADPLEDEVGSWLNDDEPGVRPRPSDLIDELGPEPEPMPSTSYGAWPGVLDLHTKQRIQAEETYRQQIREKTTPFRRVLRWTCGLLTLLVFIVGTFAKYRGDVGEAVAMGLVTAFVPGVMWALTFAKRAV